MGLQSVNVILLIAFSCCLMENAFAKPRDSTTVPEYSVVPINNDALSSKEDTTTQTKPSSTPDVKIPGFTRISCEYEEATEDSVCQEHCLPKGYTYGICVSHTCSCI